MASSSKDDIKNNPRNSYSTINSIIKKNNFKTYLEVGIAHRECFDGIELPMVDKIGVDPWEGSEPDYLMDSDTFFDTIDKDRKWDMIFIDGLHVMEQADKDVVNALKHLNDGGVIMMHDCNPPTERHTITPRVQKAWNGTVFKSWIKMRCTREDLSMFVINSDWGCGIIQKGQQKIWDKDPVDDCLEYSYLEKNRESLLNLISTDEFNNMFRKKEWWEDK